MTEKEWLLELIVRRALLYNEKEGFVLSSGRRSTYYLDCRRVTLYAPAMRSIGKLFWNFIRGLEPHAVAGMTLGADPLVCSVAFYAFNFEGREIEALIVRKEPKGHGTNRWIEGFYKPGMRVVVLEDVVTTGASSIKAAERIEAEGMEVVGVCCLVDRMEGGRDNIIERGYSYYSLFTFDEVKSRWEEIHGRAFKLTLEDTSEE